MTIDMPIEHEEIPEHGSPQDRGSADKYYGRPYDPHWYPGGTYNGRRITQINMTADEIAEYKYGYDNETDEKDWGY